MERGMRPRKHAMVVVLPRNPEAQHARRLVTAMERTVREYAAMAQWMQPEATTSANAHEATRSRLAGTRLMLSLNVLFPVGTGDDVVMARAVTISGQASQVSRKIAAMIEDEIKKWRRMVVGRSGESNKDAQSRCGAFMRLLDDLASHQFVVSVMAPADALPFVDGACTSAELIATLQEQVKIEFVLLRDEDEQTGIASKNVLQLLRGIKSSANKSCSFRQLEECEVELQGVVKEWLHAAAPVVCATLLLSEVDDQEQLLELEIRANFVLVRATEAPASSWMALHSALSNLRFHHLVLLKSVHPAMLLGCPLRAQPTNHYRVRGQAFSHYLGVNGYGGLVSCTQKNGVHQFFLMVKSPGSGDSGELLMHSVASAEEILLPEPGMSESSSQHQDDDCDKIEAELSSLQQLPIQDFNVFRNRSGVLDAALADTSESDPRAVGTRLPSAKPSRNSAGYSRKALTVSHQNPPHAPSTASKKRRL